MAQPKKIGIDSHKTPGQNHRHVKRPGKYRQISFNVHVERKFLEGLSSVFPVWHQTLDNVYAT